jgi:hypothetical protein
MSTERSINLLGAMSAGGVADFSALDCGVCGSERSRAGGGRFLGELLPMVAWAKDSTGNPEL